MKKLLLLSSLLLSNFVLQAQQNISFEASEGYVNGLIGGQYGWAGVFAESDISSVRVAATRATNGTKSLQFTSDSSEWDFYDGVITPQLTSLGSIFEISFDFYPESNADSDHVFYGLQGVDLNFASVIIFDYQGNIKARAGATTSTVGTYTAGQWYNVKIKYDFTASTLTYYVNNVQKHTGAIIGTTTGVDKLFFGYDNYGSGFSIDNIVATSNLGTSDFFATNFSAYPNPSTGIVNLASKNNTAINAVQITDLNGRVVRNTNTNGVSETQINISDLTTGMYFLNVQTDSGSGTTKIIKN